MVTGESVEMDMLQKTLLTLFMPTKTPDGVY